MSIRVLEPLKKGTATARLIRALIAGKGIAGNALSRAEDPAWNTTPNVRGALQELTRRELSDPLTSTSADALERFGLATDFAGLLRDGPIVTRLAPLMQKRPFVTDFPVETLAASGSDWIPRGGAIGVTVSGFSTAFLDHFEHGSIIVLAKELGQFSSPDADEIVAQIIKREVSRSLDQSFLDPASTAIADQRPASITSAGSSHSSSGSTAAQVAGDLDTMIGLLGSWRAPRWVMRRTTASYLAGVKNTAGAAEFPDITIDGGRLRGIEVVTSEDIPQIVALVDVADVLLADDGRFSISRAGEATVEMSTIPTEGTSPAEAVELVSLWQRNLVGLRIVKTISWQLAHATSCAVMSVSY